MSLNIVKIQSYYTGKNDLFMSHGDIDPRKIDLIFMEVFL